MRHPSRAAVSADRYVPDPRVLRGVRHLALAGLALVMAWPAARGSSAWVGWMPLWLVGMPLAAWWALLRFPLPRRQRQRRVQARRRGHRGGKFRAALVAMSLQRPA